VGGGEGKGLRKRKGGGGHRQKVLRAVPAGICPIKAAAAKRGGRGGRGRNKPIKDATVSIDFLREGGGLRGEKRGKGKNRLRGARPLQRLLIIFK